MTSSSILYPGLNHRSTEPFRQLYILPAVGQPADQKHGLKVSEADSDPFEIILPLATL